ncbi:hypothetical protein F5Y14DRAFT_443880 [Nemania sp. NC0429]|nr:hypothetical protein F5Y14DRAFT_443880 [Nemania sp. NC0429]
MAHTTPRIAIIGAGPAGLMFASILHHNGIPSIVFERDASAVARAQGGTLDLHEHSGQQALHAAGLLDEFRAVMRPGGEAMKIIKKDGTVLFEDDGERGEDETRGGGSKFVKGRPEIDRPALKDLLIASLPADTVRWGSKVVAVSPVPDCEQWDVELKDSPPLAPFDLVVGADGAWSRTRALLTETQPLYSGVTALDVWARDVDAARPDVSAFVGSGSCFLFDKDRALLFQRNGRGSEADARCYACVKTDSAMPLSAEVLLGLEEEKGEGGGEGHKVDWADAQIRETFVDRYFGDWYPEVRRVFLAMDELPVLRPLYMLPVGLRWTSRPGVTLLGDAAHLMTPFAGVGVNVALVDALELAREIIAWVRGAVKADSDAAGLAGVLRRYEEGMFARSSTEAAETEAAMHLQFQEDGGERLIEMVNGGARES